MLKLQQNPLKDVVVVKRSENGVVACLVRKLEQLGELSQVERLSIENSTFAVRQIGSDQDIVRAGDSPVFCPLLLEGFACRYKTLESGQRQIMAFHVPSDLCDLTGVLLRTLDHSICTLTPAKVALIPYATILDWAGTHRGLCQLLWRATLVDAAVSREWIVNVGRRTAYQRTAHLLCELMSRMRSAGLAQGLACDMPITQVELADALGLTPVHVNRTLQWLRSESLIELSAKTLTVRNWRELKRAAGFDATYLHQPGIE